MIPHANADDHKEEEESNEEYEETKVHWMIAILLNRPLKVILMTLLLAILIPMLLYRFLFFTSIIRAPSDGYSFGSCLVPRAARLLCGVGYVPEDECHSECCYDIDNHVCFHRFPSRFSYLLLQQWTEEVVMAPRINTVPFKHQKSVPGIRLSIDEISSTHLSLTFYDAETTYLQGKKIDNKTYTYQVSSQEMNVIVSGVNGTIFTSANGPLIAADNIWEITFKLTNETIYGLGELPLTEGTVKVIYNHDGGLSSLPVIYAKANGSYHGLLIDMQTPTEITIGGDNNIIVRSITKTDIKLHLFLGPEPKDIMRDLLDYVGRNKQLEYWMLGAHVCSEIKSEDNAENDDEIDDKEDNEISKLKKFIANAESSNLPYESHCGIRPIVFQAIHNNTDVSVIESGEEVLRAAGKRFIPHVSPYIVVSEVIDSPESENNETSAEVDIYSKGKHIVETFKDLFLRSNSSKIYVGTIKSLQAHVAYPDYGEITDDFLEALWIYKVDLDGVVLENNWPLDESLKALNETYKQLPYFSKSFEVAFKNTPRWNVSKPLGHEYIYNHNKYGDNFAHIFDRISQNITKFSSSHWRRPNDIVNRQNISTSWASLHSELVEAALGGVSGHWLWSSPICGDTVNFNTKSQMNLCIKWYMAAKFMPLIKIHSKDVARDPIAFQGTQKALMITSLNERLSFLPYFYTVLQEGPLLRPMFYEFPHSEELSNLSSQFTVGDALLIAPNLLPSQSHVHTQMPPGTWYEFWSGMLIDAKEGEIVTMTTTEADFLTFIRGGFIVAMQQDIKTSAESTRKFSHYTLVIATETVNTDEQSSKFRIANGKLFISGDMSIRFTFNETDLMIVADGDDFSLLCGADPVSASIIKEIKLYGLADQDNNYDHHKQIDTKIDMCNLKNTSQIIYPILS
ncbi:hypothetical protein ACJJTC_017978 [Scirpophaga incertulas]